MKFVYQQPNGGCNVIFSNQATLCFVMGFVMGSVLTNLIGFVIRKYIGSNNFLFLSCQMGLLDGPFFMIKHTPLPNGNHPILSPICPMGVADMFGLCVPQYIY